LNFNLLNIEQSAHISHYGCGDSGVNGLLHLAANFIPIGALGPFDRNNAFS
jgi:hypothetical protein